MQKRFIHVTVFFLILAMAGALPGAAYPSYQNQSFAGQLAGTVKRHIVVSRVNCSVIIKDLTHPGTEYSYSPAKQFAVASVIKIHVLAAALKACEEGKMALDQRVVITRHDITGGSGRIKSMAMPREFSVAELLQAMIAESDNTAANKIINMMGFDYINAACRQLGTKGTVLRRHMMDFSQRRFGVENYTTAEDVSLVLEKAYHGTLVNLRASQFAMALLKYQKVNDRIPKYLPHGTVVAHKTGLERSVVHDAGIVFSPRGDYIICVMVKGVKNYRQGKNFIARLSRLVYNLYL